MKAQLYARHCTVLAVQEMLDETHVTVNAAVFGIVVICLSLCLTHSRKLKTQPLANLMNTVLAFTNYNIGLLMCLLSTENTTSLISTLNR